MIISSLINLLKIIKFKVFNFFFIFYFKYYDMKVFYDVVLFFFLYKLVQFYEGIMNIKNLKINLINLEMSSKHTETNNFSLFCKNIEICQALL